MKMEKGDGLCQARKQIAGYNSFEGHQDICPCTGTENIFGTYFMGV